MRQNHRCFFESFGVSWFPSPVLLSSANLASFLVYSSTISTILVESPVPCAYRAGQHHRAASTTTVKINLAPSGMAVAAAECEKSASQKRRLSPRELRYAPVLTIVGIKIQCPLEVSQFASRNSLPDVDKSRRFDSGSSPSVILSMQGFSFAIAWMLCKLQVLSTQVSSLLTFMESRNLVFRDEATRKKAFWTLEGKPARKFLDECAQYDMYYVAVRSIPLSRLD